MPLVAVVVALFWAAPVFARLDVALCGTHPEKWKEELHLHRQAADAQRKARLSGAVRLAAQPRPDVGNIAIIEDGDGVVARRNEFNLEGRSIRFLPQAGARSYRFLVEDGGYDAAAAGGSPLPLGDDDFREITLPFAFPYFGGSYSKLFVNSDGNLTFDAGDNAASERSLGRMAAGPPRISGLFMDLDPRLAPDSVRVSSNPQRVVVSWVETPEYQDIGVGQRQTFQIRLYPSGLIEFAYFTVRSSGSVVGISPGRLNGTSSVLSFLGGSNSEFTSTVAERFGGREEVDMATTAQRFFETHDDAYDYVVVFNGLSIPAAAGAVAFESTARNNRTGYGDTIVDIGREYGSARRLQAVLNLGPLTQYPKDPNALVPARQASRDTPLTIIGHETGHLFLAFASIRDSRDTNARPMLGGQNAHWAFTFNSEASLLEGNRIQDKGAGASPRFATVAAAEGYSPLDQYLMGLRPPEEVPPLFLVTGASTSSRRLPQVGVDFDGVRRDILIDEIIQAEGRRTPDSTVAQRRFRFAFVLVIRQGSELNMADVDQVETYRREFEPFFERVTGGRASADTTLRSALRLSAYPAAGVIAGRNILASLTVQKPRQAPISITLRSRNGLVSLPQAVVIPAGAVDVQFAITGVRAGVDEITAEAASEGFETAVARIQVAPEIQGLKLVLASGDRQPPTPGQPLPQPVVFRIRDVNELPYPGLRVNVTVGGGGAATPASQAADLNGEVSFRWTPGTSNAQTLTARIEGAESVPGVITASVLAPRQILATVNAASATPAISPGSIASIYGLSLTEGSRIAQVRVDDLSAQVLYASDTQINFVVPSGSRLGTVPLTVTALGISVTGNINVSAVSPAIFFDQSSGYGAILIAGTGLNTIERSAQPGDYLEIYATGLGTGDQTPTVTIAGISAKVTYSGPAPGYPGVQQINIQVPPDVPSGEQELFFEIGGAFSNPVKVGL